MPASGRTYGSRPKRSKPAPKSSSGVAPNFPSYVPPRPGAYKPPKVKAPSPTKIARQQEQQYHSQAGAVRRAAKTQATPGLGPGTAVRPPKRGRQVLTTKRVRAVRDTRAAHEQEKAYKSLGEAVAKQATHQQATRSVKIGGFKMPAAALSRDPKVLKAAGFKKSGVGEAIASLPFKAAKNVPKDVAELAVTTPTSLAHLGVEGLKFSTKAATGDYPGAAKQAAKIGKEQAEPYKQAIKHPVKFATEHPVTSYLMFAPGVKVPLRAGARAARLAGKSTIRRAAATLPGTALRESRTAAKQPGSLNIARRVRNRTGATVTVKEVQRRVDEHHDLARHREEHRVAHAITAAKAEHAHLPKAERKQAVAAAAEHAREQARVESQQHFAREFGANVEPQVNVGHIAQAEAERAAAKQHKGLTRRTVKAARQRIKHAKAAARTAVQDAPTLRALEAEREAHQRELAHSQREHGSARVGVAEARGRAAVSASKTETTPRLQELEGQRKAAQNLEPHWGVELARKRVSAADRRVNAIERQVQRADERASHLEGVTVGRAQAGKMTAGAGKRAADQAERVGNLSDALRDARTEAAAARGHLNDVMRTHQGRVREATRRVDEQIRAERRRVGGVAPREHDALLSALERRDATAENTRARRAAVRDLDEQIAEERRVVRTQARGRVAEAQGEHARAVEQHGNAVQVHRRLRSAAIDTARAHRETPLVNPAGEGRLFDNPLDAKRVAYRLNQQAHSVPTGSLPGELRVREPGSTGRAVTLRRGHPETPLQFKVRPVGDGQYAVVPKLASQRMYGGGGARAQLSHASVGSGKATGAKIMRTSRGMFTQATLPLSLKWLGGQGAEAGIRALVSGAGPGSRALYQRVVERMNELEPGAGDLFAMRVRGGQFGSTSAIAEQAGRKTLAEEFEGTPLKTPAAMATMAGETAPARVARAGWRRYSQGMTHGINGLIENTTREAMAGKAIKSGPLLEHRLAGFERMRELMGKSNRAVEDAARGLMDTHSQVEAVRTVDEMYGRYSRWSPEMRSLLLHWTPFLPWYLNTAKFLFHTLPSRHPGKAALLANINVADQEWRKQNRLSLYGKQGHVPDFLMGSYPTGKDRYLRVGHYTPWGIGTDVAGSVAGLALPQILGPIKNLAGVDWKWQPLEGRDKQPFNLGERGLRALVTALEEQVPGASQAGRISGVTPRVVDQRDKIAPLRDRLMSELPTTPTKTPAKKIKARKRASGSPWGSGSGSGWGSGSGGGW